MNQGTSLRRPWDACRHAQIRSDVLHQAAEDLTAEEQAQVEQHDPLYRNTHNYPTPPSWQSSKSSSKNAPTLGGYPPTLPPKQDNTQSQWQYLLNISNTHRSSVKKNCIDFLLRVPGIM
jgi:hypothetical protein